VLSAVLISPSWPSAPPAPRPSRDATRMRRHWFRLPGVLLARVYGLARSIDVEGAQSQPGTDPIRPWSCRPTFTLPVMRR